MGNIGSGTTIAAKHQPWHAGARGASTSVWHLAAARRSTPASGNLRRAAGRALQHTPARTAAQNRQTNGGSWHVAAPARWPAGLQLAESASAHPARTSPLSLRA
eukprot:8361351-Alexandrium_andersonii.AAC.1